MKLLKKQRIPYLKILCFGMWPSILKVMFLRVRGHQVGKNVKIGFGSILISEKICLGRNVRIAPFTIIIAEHIEIGEYASIASFCYFDLIDLVLGQNTRIRESVRVGGNKSQNSKLKLGNDCLILQNTIINTTDSVEIGNNTAIGGGSRLFTHSSWLSVLDGYPVIQGRIIIGSNVWLPYDTTILPDVSIGSHVIITPRSVINKNIPNDSIAGGYPLTIRKNFFRHELSMGKKKQIIIGIFNDLETLLIYEGYKLTSFGDNHKIYVQNNRLILITLTGDKLTDKLSNQLNNNSKITVLSGSETDIAQIRHLHDISIVSINNDKPVVFNPSDSTEYLLTFLSRYGIRQHSEVK